MNKNSFDKLIKTILSCNNEQQVDVCWNWVHNLRELYNFSPGQKFKINEAFLDRAHDLGI